MIEQVLTMKRTAALCLVGREFNKQVQNYEMSL